MSGKTIVEFGDKATKKVLSDLLLASPVAGAWVWDLATNSVTWSNEVYRIFETSDLDNTLASFQDMVLPEDLEAGFSTLSWAIIAREPFRIHLRIKTRKGRPRRLLNTGRAVYDKAGNPKLVVGLVADIEQGNGQDSTAADPIDVDHDLGHLQALYDHFMHLRSQPDSSALSETDHRVLKFLLARIMPSKDADDLAATLLKKFNCLGAVLSADVSRLKEVEGLDDEHIKLLKVTQYSMESTLHPRLEPLKFGLLDTLINYLHATHAHQHIEQLRVMFLDRADHLIANEIMQQGTVDQTPIYAREIVKRSLELSASAIILVHNHPSGNPTPSPADVELTNRISKLSNGLGIEVRDHIILGRHGHTSLRRSGFFH